ncbi:AraC family transcriptional regulator [Sphingopyxis sp. PAMC25046]|uniref:helix-turn-helix domain-containing protein n=1 Tax=Sphingopyxis sp. PAMC25046 TaxID=2565556 RepID=UPI0014484171|nr:AraC family transcriptional regulator [Sphingopyxis sp. PAMC25046]
MNWLDLARCPADACDMTCECVVHTRAGRLLHPSGQHLGRHRHDAGFAAVVLSGSYCEAGDRGRMHVQPGDVILHGAYESHLDRVERSGAEVLVLPWRGAVSSPLGSIRDPDRLARLAEKDLSAATSMLESDIVLRQPAAPDWPDQLAMDLRRDPATELEQWARSNGLRPETISRGFRKLYGIAPSAYRARSRILRTLPDVAAGKPFAEIAADCGFADQSHFTRSFASLVSLSPSRWRSLTGNI